MAEIRLRSKFAIIVIVSSLYYACGVPVLDEVAGWFEHEGFPGLRDDGLHAIWSYEDTSEWADHYPQCAGKQQSPIDIQPKEAKAEQLPKLVFRNYGKIRRMKVNNNGHTVVFSLPDDLSPKDIPIISGGGLEGEYKLVQFHLHWGENSNRGSEHTIRHRAFAGELHLVHFNSKYETFKNATAHADGLAVLSVLIKVGLRENPYFAPVVDQLYQVMENGDETTLYASVVLRGLLPVITDTYYRYSGSLTAPACEEVVTWTVFDKPISVSEDQIAEFRELFDSHGKNLVDNFRSPLPLYNRTVIHHRPQ